MDNNLANIKVAILVEEGFEQVEMTEPRQALERVGAKTFLISPVQGKVKGWAKKTWGDEFPVDIDLNSANPEDYDALLLPGGVISPDKLRINETAIAFIKHFVDTNKPIAAICHGPWTLIHAEGVRGKNLTSWPSIKLDLVHAGAKWVDKEVVKDGNLITSRKPDDIPAFNKAFIEAL